MARKQCFLVWKHGFIHPYFTIHFFVSFPVDLNQNASITYTPNLADFEAMRRKEQTLSEIFTELDTDQDGKIGAEELLSFCEDIGTVMTLEKAQKDIKHFDADNDGKIVKDEWIELMFPQFNVQ
jgi:Ca2+-binding EF-hand superfamily protein